jgi:elongation factor G
MSGKCRKAAGRVQGNDPQEGDAEGKYIRQTGGRGQYGHVKITVEPSGVGAGFIFENDIVGGSIPKEYIKPIEQGIREAMGPASSQATK